jgi:hypothetical protein
VTWRVVLRPEIRSDVAEGVGWYEAHLPGLGREFAAEVSKAFLALTENPLMNTQRISHGHIRWRLTKRFPYRVIYEVRDRSQCYRRQRHGYSEF